MAPLPAASLAAPNAATFFEKAMQHFDITYILQNYRRQALFIIIMHTYAIFSKIMEIGLIYN
jgi:hypothetical protein